MAAIQKCGFQLVEHPPSSPDLASSDYYLFPKMNQELGDHQFARDDDVMNAVDHFLGTKMAPSTRVHRRDPSAPWLA